MPQLTYEDNPEYVVEVPLDTSSMFGENMLRWLQARYNITLGHDCEAAVPLTDGEDVAPLRHAWRIKKIAALRNQPIGTRASGPRKDPVEVKYDELALAKVVALCLANNLIDNKNQLPKGDEYLTFGNDAEGNPVTRTRAQMIANVKAKFGKELHDEAVRMVRRAEQATRAVRVEGPINVEALGL